MGLTCNICIHRTSKQNVSKCQAPNHNIRRLKKIDSTPIIGRPTIGHQKLRKKSGMTSWNPSNSLQIQEIAIVSSKAIKCYICKYYSYQTDSDYSFSHPMRRIKFLQPPNNSKQKQGWSDNCSPWNSIAEPHLLQLINQPLDGYRCTQWQDYRSRSYLLPCLEFRVWTPLQEPLQSPHCPSYPGPGLSESVHQ